MKSLAYMPGCWATTTTPELDRATRAVAEKLDWQLVDFPWTCCGDFAVHLSDPELGQLMAARNLAEAERLELDVMSPCAGAFRYGETARRALRESPERRKEFSALLGIEVEGRSRVRHLLECLAEDMDDLAQRCTRILGNWRLAAYYGCRLARPRSWAEACTPPLPGSMERILETLGARAVPWSHEAECCGAFHAVPRPDVAGTRASMIHAAAQLEGAEAIVVACPWCWRNLACHACDPALPVFHLPQVVGLALGCSPRSLGLWTDPAPHADRPLPRPEGRTP